MTAATDSALPPGSDPAIDTGSRRRVLVTVLVVGAALVAVLVGARVLGARSVTAANDEADARARAAGFVNRLRVADMLDVSIRLSIVDVDHGQWGLTPPDDEPPAGLEAEVIGPNRVSAEVGLRPLRIVDGGGDATFTIEVRRDDAARTLVARIPTRSNSLEYCTVAGPCIDGYGWFDWQDAPDPPLDVFRRCVESERVVGAYVDPTGTTREVRAVFQCDATRFQTALSIFS